MNIVPALVRCGALVLSLGPVTNGVAAGGAANVEDKQIEQGFASSVPALMRWREGGFSAVAEVVAAQYCLEVRGEMPITSYELKIEEAWKGAAKAGDVVTVFSDWAICRGESGEVIEATLISNAALVHHLVVGDVVAINAIPHHARRRPKSRDDIGGLYVLCALFADSHVDDHVPFGSFQAVERIPQRRILDDATKMPRVSIEEIIVLNRSTSRSYGVAAESLRAMGVSPVPRLRPADQEN